MPLRRKPAATLDDHLAVSHGLAAGVLDTFESMVLDLYNANFIAEEVEAQANAEADRHRALAIEAANAKFRNETVIANIRALTAGKG